MAKKDFYSILGVAKNASQKDIRQAYRKLAREHHPDVNPGDKSSEARFKEINAANEVLADAEKRKKYDKHGDQWEHADQIEEMQRQAGGRSFRTASGEGVRFEFGDLSDLGGVFEGLFGNRGRGAPRRQVVEQPIEITLEEAFQGTARTLQLAAQEPCATCGGTGQVASAVCHVCQGTGVTITPRRIEVKIPAGVDRGSRVRVGGDGTGADITLVVSVRAHPRFERKGADLYTNVDVPLTDAVLGTEIEVPTLTSKVMLKVPALTQNGKQFRLAGLGMPRLKGEGRGNLFARVNVKLPEKLDDRERELFEELRGLRNQEAGTRNQGG
ncbi:MAG: J domain-containing protein [Dehalococcoidia bacterium]